MTLHGYAGAILKIDLSASRASELPTRDYADRFIGGRGLAAKLYWDLVPPQTKAFDADNCLICASGPAAGFSGFAGSRWQVCSKTIIGDTEAFSYGNLGGKWGVALKYAGFDALAVQGKAQKPLYMFIKEGRVEFLDAAHMWGKTTFDTIDILKARHGEGVSVLTIGPAAENQIPFATLLAEEGASGSGGLGAVMGSKRLKAVVVAGAQKPVSARPDQVHQLVAEIRAIYKIAHYDREMWAVPGQSRLHLCHACGVGCGRHHYRGEDGRIYKSFCQATEAFIGDHLAPGDKRWKSKLLGSQLCDAYGLDTAVMAAMVLWLASCHADGLITEKETGLDLSHIESPEFFKDLVQKIANKQGFGGTLAMGTIEAAKQVGPAALERIGYFVATRNSETKDYDPRFMPMNALLYATEPRRPIQQLHEALVYLMRWIDWTANPAADPDFGTTGFPRLAEKLWGSRIAADFTTIEGKGQAAINIQERAYIKDSLVLCDLSWMNIRPQYLNDHPDGQSLECRIYAAVTGRDLDDAEFFHIGSRIYNLQRAIQLRQGWPGRQGDQLLPYYHHQPMTRGEIFYNPDCIIPGPNGAVTDVTGAVLDREDFEKMKSDFYQLRGWDVESGLPTRRCLEKLELMEVADGLAEQGLVK